MEIGEHGEKKLMWYKFTYFAIKQIKQNSFNPMSDNSQVLTIKHLRQIVPRP